MFFYLRRGTIELFLLATLLLFFFFLVLFPLFGYDFSLLQTLKRFLERLLFVYAYIYYCIVLTGGTEQLQQ